MPSLRKRKQINMADESGSESDSSGADSDEGNFKIQAHERTPSKTPVPRKDVKTKASSYRARLGKAAALPEGCTILDAVKQQRSDLNAAAKSWIGLYQIDKGDAMAALLTFFVQAAGCLCEITKDEVEEGDTDKIMRRALKCAHEEGIDDHFKGKGAKSFSDNYVEWWVVFVREAAVAEVLFDSVALERLFNLVVTMASSVVRNFRAAATTAAMQLMTAMVRVMNALSDETDTSQRQLDIETKRKGGGQVAAQRALKRAVDLSHHRNTELKSHIEALFDSVAAHRFRDVSEEVRTTVIEAVGRWIVLRPATFLEDKYLKYIGWALSDKDAVVRLAAAAVLVELYGEEDHVSMLSKFTMRFAGRYAELVYDLSEAVSVKGIQLMTRLAMVGAVEGTAMQDVYRLLVDDSAAVRRAAAILVADLLPSHGARMLQAAPKENQNGRCKSGASGLPSDTELQLAGLMYIAYLLANNEEDEADTAVRRRESLGSSHKKELALDPAMAAHVVDALFDNVPLLGSEGWRSVVAVLREGSCGGEQLTAAQATNLLLLLQFGVRRACGGTLVALLHQPRKPNSKAAKAAADDAQRTATLLFMKALPELIPMYHSDPGQASALAGIFTDLRMEVWALKSEELALASLLQQVADMFMKHVQPASLLACASALSHASSTGTDSTQEQAVLVADNLCSRLAQQMAQAAGALDSCSDSQLMCSQMDASTASAISQQAVGEARNAAFALTAGIARAEQLLTELPQLASQPAFAEALQAVLQAGGDGRELGADILGGGARCALMVLLWKLYYLRGESQGASEEGAPSEDAAQQVVQLRSDIMALLEATLQSTHEDAVREAVALVLGDLYLAFSSHHLGGNLATVAQDPGEDALHALWLACEDVLVMEPDADPDFNDEVQAAVAAEDLSRRQEAAALVVGRLAVFTGDSAPRHLLASRLLSHAYSHGPAVEAACKEVCRMLKKGDGVRLPQAYAGAIVEAWQRCERGGASNQEAVTVADRIAATYAGFNACGPAVTAICNACGEFALRDVPANLDMLHVLKPFVARLAPEAAAAWAVRLREGVSDRLDKGADEWQPLLTLVGLLQDRAHKRKTPKATAMKKGAVAAADGTPGQVPAKGGQSAARRIVFAAASESPPDTPTAAAPSSVQRISGSASISRRRLLTTRAPAPVRPAEDDSIEEADDMRAASEDELEEASQGAAQQPGSGDEEAVGSERELSPHSSRPRRERPKMKSLFAAHSEDENGPSAAPSTDADEIEGDVRSAGEGANPLQRRPSRTAVPSPTTERSHPGAPSSARKPCRLEMAALPVARKRVRRR